MKSAISTAEFITTAYTPSFAKESTWGVRRPRLYQHTDLVASSGLPVFVKDFELARPGKATLEVSALGITEIYINGKKVTEDRMVPGWTNYNKRTLFCTYDVTDKLVKGKNRILAVVASGWYCGRIAGFYYGEGTPAVKLALTSGKTVVTTDKTWLACVCGRIRTADIWDGEFCDAREASYADMSLADYDTAGWKAAKLYKYKGEVTPFVGVPVRIRKGLDLKPESITVYDGVEFNGSDYGKIHVVDSAASLPLKVERGQKVVIDLGQEMVGHLCIKAKGEKGATLKMRYAEFLNDSGEISRGNDGPEGSVYTINLRSALAKAYYVFGSKRDETYRPTFTFFGFRYVELSADCAFTLKAAVGEVVGSDNRETGTIRTDNELVNRLISNALWGQRGNYLSVPTDCPQRDERLGWTGDAQAFSMTAAYNADVYDFFLKWMQDMRDSQGKEGGYADVNPKVGCCHGEFACAWGDAGIIIPYNMYQVFGNTQIIEEHYASMEKYIAGVLKVYGLKGPEPRYGDWLAYDWCDNKFVSSAYYVHDIDLMVEMSLAIGKEDKAEEYTELAKKARAYFRRKFMKKGRLIEQTQCNKVLALAFKLIDGDYAKEIADELEKQIKANGNRLSTGFLGTYNLCPTLSEYGKDNMAYTLLLQRDEPSWLYSVDQGATTIWERWNSYTKANGFGDVGMNSFNHYAYGAIVEWMYRYMAGIQPAEPGFTKIKLTPRIDTRTGKELPEGQQNITEVEAEFNSAAGMIRSAWKNKDTFVYECSVPKKTTAVLTLPVFAAEITVNGIKHSVDEYEKTACGKVKIALAPGEYVFEQVK